MSNFLNSELLKKLGAFIFILILTIQFWKYSLNGIFNKKIEMRRGKKSIKFTGSKAVSFGILWLLAALGCSWLILTLLLEEFTAIKFLGLFHKPMYFMP